MAYYVGNIIAGDELYHHGIKGQKWGVRRYQNEDGSLTEAGKQRYAELGYVPVSGKRGDSIQRGIAKAGARLHKKAEKYTKKALDEKQNGGSEKKYKKYLDKASEYIAGEMMTRGMQQTYSEMSRGKRTLLKAGSLFVSPILAPNIGAKSYLLTKETQKTWQARPEGADDKRASKLLKRVRGKVTTALAF